MEKTRGNYPSILREIALFASAALISTGILVWVLRLWQADLRVPFHYADDALFHTMLIKGIMENGWSFQNAFIGMPTGQTLYDFPIPENLHILGLKLLVLCTHNVALTLNLYYLLSFPLTTLCALYVFRKLRISSLPAVVASLLFTFLPYHFLRGVDHLFLAAYFLVPFAILLSVWVCFDQDLLLQRTAEGKTRINFISGKTRLALIACVLLGSIGGYYAFFSCFFILLAGIFGLTWYKDAARVRTGIILCEIIAFTLILNALPNVYLALAHGSNHAAILRPRISGECFPLKVTQLVLPATGHRLPSFAALKSEYNDAAPLVNENDFST
ncbi:MAG TPA: hypothetical protein VHR86_10445, partial [Armatimonadota bacterium]|nr:hypothetical protein [Armatimonadota bacterium]